MTEQDKDLQDQLTRLRARLAASESTDPLMHLARAVAGVEDPALSHEECETQLPTYVDEEVAGLKVAQLYPEVKHHLELCNRCAALYLDMLELALAEAAGQIPLTEPVPAPDLSFLPAVSFVELAKGKVLEITRGILAKLAPAGIGELDIFGDIFFERLGEVGRDFILTPRSVSALGFSSEGAPLWLRTLVATYETTRRLAESYLPEEIQAQLGRGEWLETVGKVAQQVGEEILDPNRAQSFAQHYQAALRDQATLWPVLSKTIHAKG